jgi:hypothetical protein
MGSKVGVCQKCGKVEEHMDYWDLQQKIEDEFAFLSWRMLKKGEYHFDEAEIG